MVVVNYRHPCYLLFLCGHGCIAPSLLLFLSWPWSLGTINFVAYFMVMLVSLLLLLPPRSWLPNAIVAPIATFVVTITWCHCYCYCFFHNPGCLVSSYYCCSCFFCGCVHLQNTFAYYCLCFHHGHGHSNVIITLATLFIEQNVLPSFLALSRCGMVDVECTLV